MMTPDVELSGICKSFGDVQAVRDVSLTVMPGTFFSLLGPSGCGKTTLLRIISGFEWPDAGTVCIAGDDVSRVPPHRRPTNLVFQRWALFPHLTVTENVAFGLRVKRVPKEEMRARVSDMLDMVGLGALGNRKPSQLSGGQQQRVALARALVNRPRVLLLDEPLSSLDLKLRTQMQVELKRLQEEVGATFVYVTHDQVEAMTMSDAIAVVRDGRAEQVGSPAEIYDHPRTRFVAGFIGETNLLDRDGDSVGSTFVTSTGLCVATSAADNDRSPYLSIRQERVRVGAALAGPNRFPGVVRNALFTGSRVRYLVKLDGAEMEIAAETGHDGVTTPFAAGTPVEVGWDPEAAVLLTE